MLKRVLYLVILAAIIFSSVPASAKILLKPNGRESMALIARSVAADVTIDGQFATTTQTLVFQNENDYRMEADFMYTLPAGAVATYFAYWAGEEKVVARIVEKEEAKKIYKRITSRRRDPALVEMIGKNTFRARIFPIFPNADLKIELKYVQVLPSDKSAAVYSLALPGQEQPDPLDDINIKVRIKPDANITGITNNYGLPVTSDNQDYSFNLSGENYRPLKDLNIRLNYKKQPVRISLYSAYSGGSDGFFALSLTPDHSLANPKIKISGVKTYDVVSALPKSIKAGNAVTVLGRYKGNGKAVVTLAGKSATGPQSYCNEVQFSSVAEPENLATKLWAAQKIETLGKNSRNRSTVITLSKRFTLPSRYTSWLAVPKEEMKTHKRDELSSKLYPLVQQLENLVVKGKESDPRVKALGDQMVDLCNEMGLDPKKELAGYFWDGKCTIAVKAAELKVNGKGSSGEMEKALAQLQVLCNYSNNTPEELINEYLPGKMSTWLTNMITEGKADDPQVQAVWKEFNSFSKGEYRHYLSNKLDSKASELAILLLKEQQKTKQDHILISKLQEQMKNLKQERGDDYDEAVAGAYQSFYEEQAEEISEKLANLICSGKGDDPDALKLRQVLNSMCSHIDYNPNSRYRDLINDPDKWLQANLCDKQYGVLDKYVDLMADGKSETPEGIQLNKAYKDLYKELEQDPQKELLSIIKSRINSLAYTITSAKRSAKPDTKKIAMLQKQIQRLEKASGISAQSNFRQAEISENNSEVYEIICDLVDMISNGRTNTRAYQQQKQHYTVLTRQLGSALEYHLQNSVEERMSFIACELTEYKHISNPDLKQLSILQKELKHLEEAAGHTAEKYIRESEAEEEIDDAWELRRLLSAELHREKPNSYRLERLRKQFKADYSLPEQVIPNDNGVKNLKDFDGIIDDAISTRLQLVDISKEIETVKTKKNDKLLAELEAKKTVVEKKYNLLEPRLGDTTYRWGDPLIAIEAPADAQQVIALMPDGEIKVLVYNTDSKRWEARFDIPSYASEGEYVVKIVIVLKDGTRKSLTMSYKCDLTAPKGNAKAQMVSSEQKLRLELDADDDTARVVALLPWGERIELSKSSEPNKFFALASVPADWQGKAVAVQFVLTDRAHNRTSVVLDMAAK